MKPAIDTMSIMRKLSKLKQHSKIVSQPPITCSKLTKETLEQGVKYAQS